MFLRVVPEFGTAGYLTYRLECTPLPLKLGCLTKKKTNGQFAAERPVFTLMFKLGTRITTGSVFRTFSVLVQRPASCTVQQKSTVRTATQSYSVRNPFVASNRHSRPAKSGHQTLQLDRACSSAASVLN